ncbi:MAG: dihydroorotase [Nitrospirota bacterium]
MRVFIQNGHIIDPSQGIDGAGDIFIEHGKIKEITLRNREQKAKGREGRQIERHIDAGGLTVFPGLIDMHVHLREPGFEHKETISTGTLAAIKGGFTTVCCMPNTFPVNDNASVTEFIKRKASQEGYCTVLPIGAITKGQRGEELAEIGTMRKEGCIAFSDDGHPVMSSLIMRRALEYSRAFDVPVISHCEDLTLSEEGVMNEGIMSVTLGLKGIPAEAEQIMIFRDILLAELTGGRLHIAHVSTAGSVQLIRSAKSRGISVTAETCPHYFSITEEAVKGYDTNAKVSPPLRTWHDVEAIREGLRDGTIDVIATDHAPHHRDEKMREFDMAPFGISGLETAVSLSLNLVEQGILTTSQLVEKMALNPARILRIAKGTMKPGSDADIVLIDSGKEFTVEADRFISKGKNTPFQGWNLRGKPILTICRGKIHE